MRGCAILCIFVFVMFELSCLVKEKCYSDRDCSDNRVCNRESGECRYQCVSSSDCLLGFECRDHRCVIVSQENKLNCPNDMVNIENSYCIDRYEASRPDATKESYGNDNSYATSRKGVLPWLTHNNDEADRACKAAGKRLCSEQEWYFACAGKDKRAYAYGNVYDPKICNGIDTFGRENFHIMPTGSFENCKNEYGVYDLNGNVWEHILGGSAKSVRGGAYNCGDSERLHKCNYVPFNWEPSAQGFRCCKGRENITDVGYEDISDAVGEVSLDSEIIESYDDTGCIEEDIVSIDAVDSDDILDAFSDDTGGITGEDIFDVLEFDDIESGDIEQKICPPDMVMIDNRFCMDRYEASRPDATESSPGVDTSFAASKQGVIPWFPISYSIAKVACENAGKRLCHPDEWGLACSGKAGLVYSYGNTYDPIICNGIDAFCSCDNPTCSSLSVCPYPHCYNSTSAEGGGPCGANFHVVPTGTFENCKNEWGVYDINGNVWEIVDYGDGVEHFRGGAYNCSDSETLHKCEYDATTWGPSAKGFRCCKDL